MILFQFEYSTLNSNLSKNSMIFSDFLIMERVNSVKERSFCTRIHVTMHVSLAVAAAACN